MRIRAALGRNHRRALIQTALRGQINAVISMEINGYNHSISHDLKQAIENQFGNC